MMSCDMNIIFMKLVADLITLDVRTMISFCLGWLNFYSDLADLIRYILIVELTYKDVSTLRHHIAGEANGQDAQDAKVSCFEHIFVVLFCLPLML